MRHNTTHPTFPKAPSGEAKHMVFGATTFDAKLRRSLRAGIGTFSKPTARTVNALRQIGYFSLPEEVTNQMRTQKPRSRPMDPAKWAHIRTFVTDSVALTLPQTPYTARVLTSTATRYVDWAVFGQRLPLQAEVLWRRELINEWALDETLGLSEGTRRNYRKYLARIADAVEVEPSQLPFTPINRKGTEAPYTPAEMISFREWAANQPSALLQRRGVLMLVLCAGAGLTSSEVGQICPEHVLVSDRGIMIDVQGNQPRLVPLLAEWDDWLLAILAKNPPQGEPLWGATKRKDKSNLLSSFVETASGKGPRGDRLRHTWIVTQLTRRAPMKELFLAAGVRKMEHLGRLLEFVPPLTGDEYLQTLRGEATR